MADVSLESLWAAVGFKPNPSQEEAIRSVDGPLFLTAGPGSGKTRVLLWRTVNLIVFQGVAPSDIFLGTFTEKGAHQLREGLRGLLAIATDKLSRPFDISQMAVGTIHSNCHRILLHRGLAQGGRRPRTPVLLDEFAQYRFVYELRNWERLTLAAGLTENANATVIEYFTGRGGSSRHGAVVEAIKFFNRCSEESIDPESTTQLRDKTARGLLRMYAEYRKMLADDPERPLTDLSLLQTHAYGRLMDTDKGASIYRHVIIDEYQDTNSIQERIYFRLAETSKNICVVGDDDQALYRFRGATVDNFLAFPDRCKKRLGATPKRIPLVRNYRSRRSIVEFYNRFMEGVAWTRGRRSYRVEKTIEAHSADARAAVFSATPGRPEDVADEVAVAVQQLIKKGRVGDPNEIAFLFPSLGSAAVPRMRAALEARGLKVYAPRAGTFIEVAEAQKVFGVFLNIFGNPGHMHEEYRAWLDEASAEGKQLIRADAHLARFVKDRQREIESVVANEQALLAAAAAGGLGEQSDCDDAALKVLRAGKRVPPDIRRFLESRSLTAYIKHQRERRRDRPITVRYVINRACSLDWGVLDLFYQLTAFDTFKKAFDLAQAGSDEGPICNLSLVSDYLARFQEESSPVITAQFLSGRKFARRFFASYLYSIYRLGQTEYEDKQDPFPKGRIPFLTVHQAKGLEFSVVVLGNLRRDNRGPSQLERLMDSICAKRGEPLEVAPEFDIARMFYVALSRAKQLLVLAPYRGPGQRINEVFAEPLNDLAQPLADMDHGTVEAVEDAGQGAIPRPYSFTGDYIGFKICPRRYMMYRQYNFVPSRSQTTIFGNLVHQTIEDLHQWLIHERSGASGNRNVAGVRS